MLVLCGLPCLLSKCGASRKRDSDGSYDLRPAGNGDNLCAAAGGLATPLSGLSSCIFALSLPDLHLYPGNMQHAGRHAQGDLQLQKVSKRLHTDFHVILCGARATCRKRCR